MDNSAHGECQIFFQNEKITLQGQLEEGVIDTTKIIRIEFPNGGVYEGLIQNGKAHGRGKFVDKTGHIEFEGDWQNGLPHGQGILDLGQKIKIEGNSFFYHTHVFYFLKIGRKKN